MAKSNKANTDNGASARARYRRNAPKKGGVLTAAAVCAVAVLAVVFAIPKVGDYIDEDGNIAISIDAISETAAFYPITIDGTDMEVLAVRASDGTIRTAFNTCQVCYDSGRGYYEQSGGELVCQNCGNRFDMSMVGVLAGGCNPWPIFDGDRTVTDEYLTIPREFLVGSREIFSGWKSAY
jgi:uncharacterized membrane protein